jgi:CMP-N-acetylneuraminic acid synthetase
MSPRIVALVPMRHRSERVPGKNFRAFAGKPLYHRVVSALDACEKIDRIVIDTDSPTIMEDCAREFPRVRVLERPEHLRAGTVPTNDVLLHDVQQEESDFYLQTHSTNPLLTTATITRCIDALLEKWGEYDSLFTVTRCQERLWDQLGRAINHNPAILLRTQDLPPVWVENSNLYLFTRSTLETHHNRIGSRPMMMEIDRLEAWDIDEESDFRIAELLFLEREKAQE